VQRLRRDVGSVTIALALAIGGCTGGADSSLAIDSFTMDSEIVGDAYRIRVLLPDGYGDDAAARYPTLYLLDANWNFAGVANIVAEHRGEMEPIVVVGISPIQASQPGYTGTSPARCRDLTPTAFQPDVCPRSGGAHDFAEFLRTELVPRIDAGYRTIADADHRAIAGSSLGGLFVVWSMLEYTDTYRKYLAPSPSLWWDGFVTASEEEAYAGTHTALNATLFTSVSTAEGPVMVDGLNDLAASLAARGYTGFTLRKELLAGYSHDQAMLPAYAIGIPWMFPRR
jgi:predicted alpha/beta superfamily hydrolase